MQIFGCISAQETTSSPNLPRFLVTCDDICDSRKKCFYPLDEEILPDPTLKDCEAALYTLDGVLLDHHLMSTNPTNLSSQSCADELLLKVNCISPKYQYVARYSVVSVSFSSGFTNTGHLSSLLVYASSLILEEDEKRSMLTPVRPSGPCGDLLQENHILQDHNSTGERLRRQEVLLMRKWLLQTLLKVLQQT
ncbi:hypothetical protein Q7C36_004069 [Tachysurus vachellii]|uniref:Uncharacterized protein n=1 Tax=Tachysurus vachellii TaxID=175792 RepID=A0AA88T9W8_TACVA|nr:hypothetical protein Q7C36_004069 [Tachysurus vachellii]